MSQKKFPDKPPASEGTYPVLATPRSGLRFIVLPCFSNLGSSAGALLVSSCIFFAAGRSFSGYSSIVLLISRFTIGTSTVPTITIPNNWHKCHHPLWWRAWRRRRRIVVLYGSRQFLTSECHPSRLFKPVKVPPTLADLVFSSQIYKSVIIFK